jgi:elongation factor Ts
MQITPQMVKELRESTGAGMADCKKALEETQGNFEEAVEYLRKKGAASAAKRADKDANEGLVVTATNENNKKAALVEVTCETDFVAKNQEYVDYVNSLVNALITNNITTKEDLLNHKIGNDTVQDLHNGILAKFSEKIDINRIEVYESTGHIVSYIHGGSKLAVLLDVSSDKLNDTAKQLVKDIAMQIAAMQPVSVDRSGVTAETLEKEKEIYKEQAIQEGKNPDIAEKVALGRVEKFYKENCLVEQVFVKDSKKSVSDVLAEISKEIGEEVKINRFARIAIGE